MSFELIARWSPPLVARVTGGLFVLYIAASFLADTLAKIGVTDSQQVFTAMTSNPLAFRLGLLAAFVSGFIFVVTAWALYVLLARVGPQWSLLFLLLNAVGVAVQCASLLALIGALQLVDPVGGPPDLSRAQVNALAYWSITVYETGFVAAQLFFGTWLFPLGYLVYRSGFLPRVLGVLLILDGVAEMVWLVQALVVPTRPDLRVPGIYVSLLAEVGLALWLLIMGVKVPDGQAAEARVPPTGMGRSSG
ncbi:DUF4386 domain-containing protein [Gordonia rhizosphera NBRC 16068]|uniref:DUF4386 domain-containing protein n=1 Tax=Gordonia rhizosphera TaxID=83341 RepID=UPI0012F6345B